MKKLIYMMAFLAIASQLTNCKKDDDDDDDDTPTTNVLCDGKGGNVWMPIDSTNNWTYSYTIAGISQGNPVLTAGTTAEHDGNTYRVITDGSGGMMLLVDYEVREDASTHDLYKWYDFYGEEWLEIPGSPTLNQEWPIYVNHTRKVTNLNASLSTSSCSYTGLLEIQDLDANQQTVRTYYYKKGLGLVKQSEPGQFGNVYTLTGVSLK